MKLILGDCIEKMKELPSNSIDAIITDPPYNLFFMKKEFDCIGTGKDFQEFNFKWATEALRILKPGGFMFAMGGTRTHHRLTCGIEDAGFMIRDELCWVYMQGFPKAQDLGMLIEKKLGGKGEDTGVPSPNARPNCEGREYVADGGKNTKEFTWKEPTLPQAKEWSGWKTPALKPAFEPIVVAQKPCEGSITENVMKHGVGGYNVDECRIPYEEGEEVIPFQYKKRSTNVYGEAERKDAPENRECNDKGRFPSNLLMQEECFGKLSKFFLIPKTSKGEKEENLVYEGNQNQFYSGYEKRVNSKTGELEEWKLNPRINNHPTVKPVALMEHLIKLTTKIGYTVLDPFMGSGTTGIACDALGRNFIGIELSPEYFKIAEERIKGETKQGKLYDWLGDTE